MPLLTVKFCTLTTPNHNTIHVKDKRLGFIKNDTTPEIREIHDERSQFTTRNKGVINFSVWTNKVTRANVVTFLQKWGSECRGMKLTNEQNDTAYPCHLYMNREEVTRCTVLHFENNTLQLYIIYYKTTDIQFMSTDDPAGSANWYHECLFLKLLLGATLNDQSTTITVNGCIEQILTDGHRHSKLQTILEASHTGDLVDSTSLSTGAETPTAASADVSTLADEAVYGKARAVKGLYLTSSHKLIITFLVDNNTSWSIVKRSRTTSGSQPDLFIFETYGESLTNETNLLDSSSDDTPFVLVTPIRGHPSDTNVFGLTMTLPEGTYQHTHTLPADKEYLLFHVYRYQYSTNQLFMNNIGSSSTPDDFYKNGMEIKDKRLYKHASKGNNNVLVIVFTYENSKWTNNTADYFDIGTYARKAGRRDAPIYKTETAAGGALPAYRTPKSHRHTQKHKHPQKHSRRRHRNHV